MTDAARKLAIETEAAKRLLAHLREEDAADDVELVADAVEGETSLHEAVAAAVAEIDEAEIFIVGCKTKEATLSARRKARERRIEFLTAAIEQAMVAAEMSKIALPSATLFLSRRAPKVIIENEADVPSRFFVEQERPAPKLDLRAVAEALKAKEAVPGATLDNGGISLSRRAS